MTRITEKLSAITGAGIFSVPVFVVQENDEELTLIDCGLEKDTKAIIKKIKKKWGSLGKIKQIILTHRHHDHTGGLPELLEEIRREKSKESKEPTTTKGKLEVEIICHEEEAPLLPEVFKGIKIEPTRTVKHEEMIDESLHLRAIHVPGHTLGHICLLLEDDKVLILGDVIVTIFGRVQPAPKRFYDDFEQAEKSLKRLLDYEWDYGIPSHTRARKIPRKKIEKVIKRH